MVLFRAGSGFDQTFTRLSGTTLLWQRRVLLIRVEGNLSRAPSDRALALDADRPGSSGHSAKSAIGARKR